MQGSLLTVEKESILYLYGSLLSTDPAYSTCLTVAYERVEGEDNLMGLAGVESAFFCSVTIRHVKL